MKSKKFLDKIVTVKIDRPLGKRFYKSEIIRK